MPVYPLMLPLFAAAIAAGGLAGWAAWRRAALPRRWIGATAGARAMA
jgi:hypothetical protein